MEGRNLITLSYYPGCSLATTSRENNSSLIYLFNRLGYDLVELEDWNCCGSSSAHSIDTGLAFDLASRNLYLAPPDRPLLVACPSCLLRLNSAFLLLKEDENAREHFRKTWGKPFNPDLEILHFFELLDRIDLTGYAQKRLEGLKFVSYYGCMLARPPAMRNEKSYYGLMEEILAKLGAEPLRWSFSSRCCGTFLTVARPEVVTPMLNTIAEGAIKAGAHCIVTACAMCHMNLEARCTLKEKLPVMHFSEVLSMAMGIEKAKYKDWLSRHLIDPRPFLKVMGLS
ncbi:MAG: hypothetical protein JRJ03_17075 [Deltaproteobacteria bacterium]|nr:hypothetical protein [Deltaproteobacteria bacterium]